MVPPLSLLMPVLHSILMWSSGLEWTKKFKAVVSFYAWKGRVLLSAERWSLWVSWSQYRPHWFTHSDISVLVQESHLGRPWTVEKLIILCEKKNKTIYPTLILDTENQYQASICLWMWFCSLTLGAVLPKNVIWLFIKGNPLKTHQVFH